MINDSARIGSLSLKFGTECDHVTADVLQTFKVSVKGQGHSLKTSSIIAPFWEIWVAKSNGNARIFIESLEVALCVHAQYKIGQKQPRTTGATSGGLSCNELAIATFSSCCCRRRRRSFYHYYYC